MSPERAVLERLLAAQTVDFEPRVLWPLHASIRHLVERAGRCGVRQALPTPLRERPSPEVGVEIMGVHRAMLDLLAENVLLKVGSGRRTRLTVNPEAAPVLRRLLMTEPAEVASLYREAGAKWAALVATAS